MLQLYNYLTGKSDISGILLCPSECHFVILSLLGSKPSPENPHSDTRVTRQKVSPLCHCADFLGRVVLSIRLGNVPMIMGSGVLSPILLSVKRLLLNNSNAFQIIQQALHFVWSVPYQAYQFCSASLPIG